MIYGIGLDTVLVSRFQRFLDDKKLAMINRIFTAEELAKCSRRKDAASCYAARFAAKEALLKAFGTGLAKGLAWHDIEVVNDANGKPYFKLSGAAYEIYKTAMLQEPLLTISHDGGHAVAMVILEKS